MSRGPEPTAVASLFGSRLSLIRRYTELLATSGVERGLIGPREVPRLWERHVLNCAVLGEFVGQRVRLADVGSGAGLPGLVLAIGRPDLDVTLIEPLLRRSTWLDEVVDVLRLDNVTVVRSRAEVIARTRPRFDVVTARAVAPLRILVPWCVPLLRRGGSLLAMKGAGASQEIAAAQPALARHHSTVELLTCGLGLVEPPTTAVRVQVL